MPRVDHLELVAHNKEGRFRKWIEAYSQECLNVFEFYAAQKFHLWCCSKLQPSENFPPPPLQMRPLHPADTFMP